MRIDTENPQKKAIREVTDDLGRVVAKYAVDRSEGAVESVTLEMFQIRLLSRRTGYRKLMGEHGLLVQQLDESEVSIILNTTPTTAYLSNGSKRARTAKRFKISGSSFTMRTIH